MPAISHEQLRAAFAAQPLFAGKAWRLAPRAWPLTPVQLAEIEEIGTACLEFHQALETLYLRSASGRNLLRNRPLQAPWVAAYLDRGKPPNLLAHARDPRNRGALPTVLRPDLLLTEEGFALTELDSVPGGIGLTAFLNRLYGGSDPAVLGRNDAMLDLFHSSLAALRPEVRNPVVALLVSEEASTYRPEMEWIAGELQRRGLRVHCLRPEAVFPLGGELFFDVEGTPERIDVVYRFFELFDWANIPAASHILEAWAGGQVAVAPPMRPFQEEKLSLALFHHHRLASFWQENLSGNSLECLRRVVPRSWIMDPAPLPPGAVLDGPQVGGRPLGDWRDLISASQKERDLIIKISGFHETAWGARSVVLGSDGSREAWQAGVDNALRLAPTHPHILQEYRKPRRAEHPLFVPNANGSGAIEALQAGRLRLCPYFFVIDGRARLGGVLATFCPPDKKIIHGMEDAALLPCAVSLLD